MEIHYFPIRGLGEMTRLALTLGGGEWKDVAVDYAQMKQCGPLFKLKDGDLVISQSLAMLMHVGRKFDLYGVSDMEKALIDEAIQATASLRSKYLELIYQHELAVEKKTEYWRAHGNPSTAFAGERNGGAHWAYVSNLLKSTSPDGRGFLVGNKPTIADAYLFDVLDLYHRIFPDELAAHYPELMAFHANFSAIPSIAEYISTRRHAKINGSPLG